jgi:hypothetical protein
VISVKRIESGKLLHEVFTDAVDLAADGWNMHPSVDRFHVDRTAGFLHLKHGETPTYLLRDVPVAAVIEMTNSYNPTMNSDVGGFVSYVADEWKLEFYEYFHPDIGSAPAYPYVRMVKDVTEYAGYGSQDGLNWDIRGDYAFPEGHKWGLALEGVEGSDLRVSSLCIYKSTSITFRGIPKNGKVLVYEEGVARDLIGECLESNYEGVISVFARKMPIAAVVEVYDAEGTLISQGAFSEVFGGDVYHCGQFMEVLYEGVPFELMNNDFGYIDSFYKDFKLEIKNQITAAHTDVNVDVRRYSEAFGWEWVEVALDQGGSPGEFSKGIVIPNIQGDSSVFFWVRIMRSSVPVDVKDYVFDFVINIW